NGSLSGTARFKLYIDGSVRAWDTTSGTADGTTGTGNSLYLGLDEVNSTYSNAIMDEFRVSTSGLSADWIATEFNNQNGASTFYSIGAQETDADITNPTVSTYSPADAATGVSSTANLVITFSEAVVTETGNITIKKLSDDSVFETIPVGDARVTGNGGTAITINPTNGMVASTAYYINIAATAFDDNAGNSYAGITDNGTWNFTTASVIVGWSNSNWASRLKITIDATKVNGDVTDFPVYVDLSDLSSKNFFNNVRSDGGEIRVTQGDGLSLVPTELVSIDTTNNQGELWFKAPFLSGTNNLDFYIYYNNANGRPLNANHPMGRYAVWSNGFVAVYHMTEDPNGDVNQIMTNSVSNKLFATPGGTMTSADKVAGQIGNGTDFDGTNDIFTAATTGISMDIGNISAWSKKDVANKDFGIWQIYTDGTDHLSVWVHATGGGADDMWALKLGGTDIVKATTAITDSNWHHVSVGYNFTSDNYELFQDGVSEASSTSSYTADTLAAEQDIGLDGTTNEYDGTLDEIHIATKARTTVWVNTEYNNQNSPSTFYSIAATVDDVNDDSTPKVSAFYPANNQDRFPLRANLVMTFNETVQAGTGNVTIMKTSNGGTFDTIAIGSATFSSSQVTINPTSNLVAGTQYYVLIDSSAIEDASSNRFAGITDDQGWTFTTEGGNATPNEPTNIFLMQ
ncbi:MAG: Ig-like domain-containing protein, partial [Cyanobacteria bacterium]|nr:Ig-like domain-containing protein [Cyanobacteriota bacterium]